MEGTALLRVKLRRVKQGECCALPKLEERRRGKLSIKKQQKCWFFVGLAIL
jgi:hypothetical protein